MAAGRRGGRRIPGSLHPQPSPDTRRRTSSSPQPPQPMSRSRCCQPTSCRRCGPLASGATPATAYVVASRCHPARHHPSDPVPGQRPGRLRAHAHLDPGRQYQRGPAGGRARSRARPFDLLATIAAAIRAAPPPATLIVISSGLSTSGGLDLRQVGWDASPSSVAAQLKARGLLPDLAGYRVISLGWATLPAASHPSRYRSRPP